MTNLEYRIKYCVGTQEWVGTCDQYPFLESREDTKIEALLSVVDQAEQTFLSGKAPQVQTKITVLDGYYATGDYESFCFDIHEGPHEHVKNSEEGWLRYQEAVKEADKLGKELPEEIREWDSEACRVYPSFLLPILNQIGRPYGKWTIRVSFEPKEKPNT